MTLPLSSTVVVATRFRSNALEQCLSAIEALDEGPSEVIVVDNSDGDEPTAQVAVAHGAKYVVAPATGLSGARNLGAYCSKSDIVVFIDDDAVCRPGWLTELREAFADPSIVAVAGRIVPLAVDSPAHRESARLGWLDLGAESGVFNLLTEDWFEKANFGLVGLGGNMAFRRDMFDSWPGFRESLGLGSALPGGEENYAFFELIKAGHSVAYRATAVVAHPYPETAVDLSRTHQVLLSHAIAYTLLLFAEEREFRSRLIAYGWRKLVVRALGRVDSDGQPRPKLLTHRQVVSAVVGAPALYARCRRQDRTGSKARATMNAGIYKDAHRSTRDTT